jgi:hypothetical protein
MPTRAYEDRLEPSDKDADDPIAQHNPTVIPHTVRVDDDQPLVPRQLSTLAGSHGTDPGCWPSIKTLERLPSSRRDSKRHPSDPKVSTARLLPSIVASQG